MLAPFKKSLLAVAFVASLSVVSAAYAASPMGYWKTIDDRTHAPKSIVRISGSPSNLTATVVKLLPAAETRICTACSGSLKNKPIQGMTVMQGLKQDPSDPNKWSGGRILDPKTGKVYKCSLTVSNNGSSVEVRGYIGMSMFGRSQTWIRASGN